jgi:hypothetical protein
LLVRSALDLLVREGHSMTSFRAPRRVGVVAAVAIASLVGFMAAPASAATVSIGQLGGTGSACLASIEAVQASVTSGTSYAVPAGNWIVTSWSSEAGDGPTAAGSLQLEMWRPTGTVNQFMLVGISPVGTTTASGTNTFSLTAPIAVQGGDLLGLRNLTQNYGCAHVGAGGLTNAGDSATAPVPGEVRTIPPVPLPVTLNITATLQSTLPELDVKKVVSGAASSGFTEHVQCTGQAANSVDAQASTTVVDVSLRFQADGTPDATATPAGWIVSDAAWQLTDGSLTGSTCTITETDSGGATSVSYSCSWTPGTSDHLAGVGCPGASSGPSATPASVVFEGNGDVGVLTVTNTFPPPATAPPPITIAPKFTG